MVSLGGNKMEPNRPISKHKLRIPGLLKLVRRTCERIQDPIKREVSIPLSDCLMSGVAMFNLKYPSLLQFDSDCRGQEMLKHNLRTLYDVKQAPSDTYMRERLDVVEPRELQKAIDKITALLQRGKVLEKYRYFKDYCLVSIDGTGYFSSHEVHCGSCCVKNHKDGTVTYYHQMLAAVMVHPSYNTVLPLALEPIEKQDGATKNDCEHNAAKRLLVNLRKSHPHLKMIIVLDGLYADAPIIKLLRTLELPYIITAKESDLDYLFDAYGACEKQEITTRDKQQEIHYKYAQKLPLNATHSDIEVNVLECIEMKKGKNQRFCWITGLTLDDKTVETIAKGGRARWKIENETFNTLKNQGYQFEHNFGHGRKNLSVVFAYLMFIAFLIDQVQEFTCKFFKLALEKCIRRNRLWNRIRGFFFLYFVDSWEHIYRAISESLGARLSTLLDTS